MTGDGECGHARKLRSSGTGACGGKLRRGTPKRGSGLRRSAPSDNPEEQRDTKHRNRSPGHPPVIAPERQHGQEDACQRDEYAEPAHDFRKAAIACRKSGVARESAFTLAPSRMPSSNVRSSSPVNSCFVRANAVGLWVAS